MHSANSRYQPYAPPLAETQAEAAAQPKRMPRRRAFTLSSIVRALAWMSAIRAMPFGGIDVGPAHDQRTYRNY